MLNRNLATLRRALAFSLVLSCSLVGLMACESSAWAGLAHLYTGTSFGPQGSGAGTFESPSGVAVERGSGDVFVYDGASGHVYKFDASGNPVNFASSGTNEIAVETSGPTEAEIAVDSSSGPDAGDIYVANGRGVRIYSSTGVQLGGLSGGEMCGVSVDPAGAVYVGVYPRTVRKYTPVVNPVTNADETASMSALSSPAPICKVAADNEGDVYTEGYSGEGVTFYSAMQFGSLAATGTEADSSGRALTVDPSNDNLLVDEGQEVVEYDSSQHLLSTSGAGDLDNALGIGVLNGALYVTDEGRVKIFGSPVLLAEAETGAVSNVSDSGATIAGSVNPEGLATTYQFEYGTSTGYGSSSPATPGSVGSDSTTHELQAVVGGLEPNTLYHYRISADDANGVNHAADMTFRTTGPPAVDAQSASGVGQREATVEAQIDPDGHDTRYSVEYGPTASYGSTTSSVDIGAEVTDQPVATKLTGLQVNKTYHYRVVATNASGTREGIDGTFTTAPSARVDLEALADAGATSATLTAKVEDFGTPSIYYFEYGTTVAYGSATPETPLSSANGMVAASAKIGSLQSGTTYHFRVAVKNEDGVVLGKDVAFSTFVSEGSSLPDDRGYELVTPSEKGDSQVTLPAGVGGESNREIVESRFLVRASADGHSIVYLAEPSAASGGRGDGNDVGNEFLASRVAPGTWTRQNLQPEGVIFATYESFSDDLSRGVLNSPGESLAPGAPAGYEDLYVRENADGSLTPMSTVTPPHRSKEEFHAAAVGGYGRRLGEYYAGASSDYKHVFFEANDALTPNAVDGGQEEDNLYESFGGSLSLVDVLPDGTTGPNAAIGAAPASYGESEHSLGAISADGSRVYWTDMNNGSLYLREDARTTKLIAEDAVFWTASSDGSRVLYAKSGDLYESDLTTGITTDLTPGGQVLGLVGNSTDAQYVYFVAEGVLASGATPGQLNLYLHVGGTTSFITTLGSERQEEFPYFVSATFSDWQPTAPYHTAEATPDGHSLVFMSLRSLTGYDNVKENGIAASEVYVYDADTGKLSCASCNPTGELPSAIGESTNSNLGGYLSVPGYEHPDTYQMRSISEDGGRVVFNSNLPLVPQDVNGRTDVYEWERDGTGSCGKSAGCIYLLSDGSSSSPSYLLDASASGGDVFIATNAQLVEQDRDELYDVYDVRVGAVAPVVPAQCTGTGCQGLAAAPPVFATPSSVTFEGVGNFPAPAKALAKKKQKPKTKKKTKARKKRKPGKKHKGARKSTGKRNKNKVSKKVSAANIRRTKR